MTFVETMVASTIAVSVGLVAVVWMTGLSDLWNTASTQAQMRLNAQLGMNRLVDELRSATRTAAGSPPNVSIPAAPNNTTMTCYLPADLDGNGSIIDATGNLEWGATAIQYARDAASRQLRRTAGGQTLVIANDVQSVTFEDAAINSALYANEVKITLTLQATTAQRRTVSATAVEIVKLRN